MYVDESGDDVMDPAKWNSPEARYLGLTGVVIASDTYRAVPGAGNRVLWFSRLPNCQSRKIRHSQDIRDPLALAT